MIIEYDTRNCPFCNEAIIGKWLANCSLPIGKKIITIDRFSNDPRLKFLRKIEEKYGGVYILPIFLILKKKFSAMILSILDCFHLKGFIKEQENLI